MALTLPAFMDRVVAWIDGDQTKLQAELSQLQANLETAKASIASLTASNAELTEKVANADTLSAAIAEERKAIEAERAALNKRVEEAASAKALEITQAVGVRAPIPDASPDASKSDDEIRAQFMRMTRGSKESQAFFAKHKKVLLS